MATIKLGLVADIHNSENANSGSRYYDDSLKKAEQAAMQFNTDGVNAIFILGDSIDDPEDGTDERIGEVKAEFDDHASGISKYWALGNHDVYTATYTKAMWMADTGMASEYYYVDVGNLRCIVLDTCYSSLVDSYPINYSWLTAYVSLAQLQWLETILTAADTAGKYSIVMCHHDMGAKGCKVGGNHTIQNAPALRALLERHKVIAAFNGHSHTCNRNRRLGNNSEGSKIWYMSLDGCVDGDFETGNGAHYTVTIDDSTGEITGVTGYYGGRSMNFTSYTAAVSEDPTAAGNWTNGVPVSGSVVMVGEDCNATADFGLGVADVDWSALTFTEVEFQAGWNGQIGGGNSKYFKYNADVLILDGGYTSDSRSRGDFNYCTCEPTGGVGNKKVKINYSEFKEFYFEPTDTACGFEGYKVGDAELVEIYDGTGSYWQGLTTDKVNLYGGYVKLGQNVDGACTFTEVNIYNDGDLEIHTTTVAITTLKIHGGGEIDLTGGTLTIGTIELYASPTTFTNTTDTIYNTKVKGNASLEYIMTADNVTISGEGIPSVSSPVNINNGSPTGVF